MLTNADIKFIRGLSKARSRAEEGLFVAEGPKLVSELLGAFPCRLLIASERLRSSLSSWLSGLPPEMYPQRIETVPDSFDFSRISSLVEPQGVVSLMEIPREGLQSTPSSPLALLLDEVQDPGNMGTIIRTADWFGVETIYLSPGCADPFAPKVVQATMGALARVRLIKLDDVAAWLDKYSGVICGTFLEGSSLYRASLSPSPASPVLVVMGNEGRGISPTVENRVHRRLTIPAYPNEGRHAESLNVGIATAIILSELRRPSFVLGLQGEQPTSR